MTYTTLISAAQLQALRTEGAQRAPLMVFDCSFDLADPRAGHAQYRSGHIPGAVYAHLDSDLSALHGAPGADGTPITAGEADTPASGGATHCPTAKNLPSGCLTSAFLMPCKRWCTTAKAALFVAACGGC